MAKRFIKIPSIPNPVKDYPGAPTLITPSPSKFATVAGAGIVDQIKRKLITTKQNGEDPSEKSILGTPVYSRCVLRKTSSTTSDNEMSGTDYVKFDNAIIIVNQNKNIVKTPIQGRNGTVKEYISDDDYSIDFSAQVIGKYPNTYPEDECNNIIKLLKEQNEIVLTSNFLDQFSISYVVVESYEFAQIQGSRGRVEFKMKLISDEDVERELGIKDNA